MKMSPVLNGFAFLLIIAVPRVMAESAAPAVPLETFSSGGALALDQARSDQGAVLGIATQGDAPALKVDLPASRGYP